MVLLVGFHTNYLCVSNVSGCMEDKVRNAQFFSMLRRNPLSTTINFNGFDLLFCRLKFLCIICCHSETKLIGTGYFADDNQHDTNFCVWRYPPLLSSSIMIIGTALAVENILHPRKKEGMEL
jgi:hypothetical protein